MRKDAVGLFWEDRPKVKKVCVPPDPIWLEHDFLPDLQKAKDFKWDFFSEDEFSKAGLEVELYLKRHELLFDIECYPNYFLLLFQSITTGKYIAFEKYNNRDMDLSQLALILKKFCLIGFYSRNYDIPMMKLFMNGLSNSDLHDASNDLIVHNVRSQDLLRKHKINDLYIYDHIDLAEIPKGSGSLKTYGARSHSKQLRDLPFDPKIHLNKNQIIITRWYCANDLATTGDLKKDVQLDLDLRNEMSIEYKTDLRSKSDAQIAEKVIGLGIKKQTGCWPTKAEIDVEKKFKYKLPSFIKYESNLMRWVLDKVIDSTFELSWSGKVILPKVLAELEINIANSTYRFGIGGLHSCEKCVSYYSDSKSTLIDRDVASYYPRIILNQKLFPEQLGEDFLKIYERIVSRRLAAKQSGNKSVSESLKIVINGSFGKFGSPHSILYSPELLIQVTITGQLSLLMLIERLELSGIHVVSANTDGVVINCPNDAIDRLNKIIIQWENDTHFETEETVYSSIHSRDVNNYIAIGKNGKVKRKGVFGKPGLSKNPAATICSDAVSEYLLGQKSISETILSCQDITKFISVKNVKGGGVKLWGADNTHEHIEYLGKVARWYYAKDIPGEIVYAKSGNKVGLTEGAKPLMKLPDSLPDDIDYDWYIEESYKMLTGLGIECCNN